MKAAILIVLFTMLSFSASAAKVECTTAEHKLLIENSGSDIKVIFKGETVLADGILTSLEVDLVAKFKSAGEMTLFAKIGQTSPDNYAFIQGKRFSVTCR